MKEIVFIRQSAAEIGGVEGQIIRLARKLFSRGCFKPVLITSDNQSAFARDFAACGFEVLAVPMSKTKILSAPKRILRILKGRHAAIIQTHVFCESLIGRAVRKKRTDIRHIFRVPVCINSTLNSGWKKILSRFLDKTTSRWVDCYIANGQYLADEIINHSKVNPDKVFAVLNGRDQIGLPDKACDRPNEPLPPRIAMIANLKKGKGHCCLVKALAELKKRNLKITARLIGGKATGSLSNAKIDDVPQQIKKTAYELNVSDQIEYYGYTKDVFNALIGISVVVLPSDSEGVPNCILEAMSLRKLVIASNTGGINEIIEHGKNGLLHKPKDYIGLADCLETVFSAPAAHWEDIRNAAFQSWRQKFTLDIMTDKFVDVYRTLGLIDND